MPTPLILALKQFNKGGNPHLWSVPRKGTPPHDRLLSMLGKEDAAKRQQEERHHKMIKRQEELSRLQHNLGIVIKVNVIRKFTDTIKQKIKAKRPTNRYYFE